jgi:hypothetical protein
MPSNISIQSVMDYARTKIRGAFLSDVLGVQNEPALSIANDVYQETLQEPLTWRFNKANNAGTGLGILYWTTAQYQQDYPLTNATVSAVPYSGNGSNWYPGATQSNAVVHIGTVYASGINVSGSTATVATNWAHNLAVGQTAYFKNVGTWVNGVFTPDTSGLNSAAGWTVAGITSPTIFTFSTSGSMVVAGSYGAPGINDIGWIERYVLEDFANTATVKPRHSVESTMNLELESIVQPPFKVSYQYSITDGGTATGANVPSTTAVFRAWPMPSNQVWGVMTDYQMAPQTFTDLSQNWGVWPDPLIFVIRQGVVAAALDFCEDPRATAAYQLYVAKRDQVQNIRDQEKPSQTIFPDRPILYGG